MTFSVGGREAGTMASEEEGPQSDLENRPALVVADGGGQREETGDPKQQSCGEMRGKIKAQSGSSLSGRGRQD